MAVKSKKAGKGSKAGKTSPRFGTAEWRKKYNVGGAAKKKATPKRASGRKR